MTVRADTLKVRYEVDGQGKVTGSFAEVETRAARLQQTTDRTASSTNNLGKSTRELNFAMRGLPMQMTDIVTSLQSGQRPLQVLLQQGGQLKDMFGGIGPAVRALTGYLAGMLTATTALAGGVALTAVAWHKADAEREAFGRALILTGNAARMTTGELTDMAMAMDGLAGVTRGQAAAALAQVAGTGKFTAEQIELVTRAALALQAAGGPALEKTVTAFGKLAGDPVTASIELHRQTGFLTEAIFEQIMALSESGQEQEAARVAMEAYGESQERVAKELQGNLTTLGRIAKSTGGFFREMWDAAVGMFIEPGPAKQLEQLGESIKALQSSQVSFMHLGPVGSDARAQRIREMKAQMADLRQQMSASTEGRFDADAAKREWEAQRDFFEGGLRYASEKEQVEQRILMMIHDGQKAGIDGDKLRLRAAEMRADFEERMAKRKREEPEGPAPGILQRISRQIVLNEQQAESEDRLTSSERLRISVQEQLAAAGDDVTAAERARIAAELEALQVSDQKLQSDIARTKALESLSRLQADLAGSLGERQAVNEFDLTGMQHGQEHMEQLRRRIEIDREYYRRLASLDERHARDKSINYAAELQALQDFHQRALTDEAAYQTDRAAMQGDWRNGAMAAMEDFISSAGDVAGQTYDVLSGTFDDLADAIARFAVTGKGSLREFATAAIAEFARVEARILLSKALQWIFNMIFPGASSPSAGFAQSFGNNTGWLSDGSFGGAGGGMFGTGGGTGGGLAIGVGGGQMLPAAASGEPPMIGGQAMGGIEKIEINNYGSPDQVRAREVPTGNGMKKIVLDIFKEGVARGELDGSMQRFGVSNRGFR